MKKPQRALAMTLGTCHDLVALYSAILTSVTLKNALHHDSEHYESRQTLIKWLVWGSDHLQ